MCTAPARSRSAATRLALLTGALSALALGATPMLAQPPVVEPPPRIGGFFSIPFNFDPPGARALGMGGSFIAVADDATAAETNPAGLVNLTRPEASLHARASAHETPVVNLAAEFGLALANGNRALQGVGPIDPGTTRGNGFADVTEQVLDGSSENLSFASYVHPFGKATISVYYQRDADFQTSTGTFQAYEDFFTDLFQAQQRASFDMESFGLAAGFRVGSRLALGASVRQTQAQLSSLLRYEQQFYSDFEFNRLFVPNTTTGQLELANLAPFSSLASLLALGMTDNQLTEQTITGDDEDITFNAGMLINPGGKFSFGLVYESGGDFEFETLDTTRRFLASRAGTGVFDFVRFVQSEGQIQQLVPLSCEYIDEESRFFSGVPFECAPTPVAGRQRIEVPDVIGVGFSWKPNAQFRIAVDARHIGYSVLDAPAPPDVAIRPTPFSPAALLEPIDDEIAFHFGLEHIWFLGGRTDRLFVVRGGFYTDPDHDGFRAIDSDDEHFTMGLGFQVKKLQVDLAGDFGEYVDRALLSMVFRFGA
jgi:long-subunit fatty acid transport protein